MAPNEPSREKLWGLARGEPPCVLGVGGRLRGDDAAGPLVCDALSGRFGGTVIDAGVAPENHLEQVVRAARPLVLVVDAMHFGGRPGDVGLFSASQLGAAGLSTHACSPGLLAEYFAARAGEQIRVRFLAIQIGSTRAPSTAVVKAAGRVAALLSELWPPAARESQS